MKVSLGFKGDPAGRLVGRSPRRSARHRSLGLCDRGLLANVGARNIRADDSVTAATPLAAAALHLLLKGRLQLSTISCVQLSKTVVVLINSFALGCG